VRRITGAMAAYSIPAAAAMGVLAAPILAITVKSDFLPAIPACLVLLAAFVVANVTIWTRPVTLAIGRPEISTWANALQSVVAVGSAILLVPRLSFVGSAWAYLFGTVAANAAVAFWIQQVLPLVGAAPAGKPRVPRKRSAP
jgi:O-antigen/teichoic acid export membrane protein